MPVPWVCSGTVEIGCAAYLRNETVRIPPLVVCCHLFSISGDKKVAEISLNLWMCFTWQTIPQDPSKQELKTTGKLDKGCLQIYNIVR